MRITVVVTDKMNLPCPSGSASSVAEAMKMVDALKAKGLNASFHIPMSEFKTFTPTGMKR